MSKKTKVLRYTEDEFVNLLENIVKRVKKEKKAEAINESRKRAARKNLRNRRV